MPAHAPPRLYLLDTLRGLASLSVVIWHYQHFFYVAPGTLAPGFNASAQPFFAVLAPFYLHGYLAVQLFFTLSGFVFFLIYCNVLADQRMGAREFFILRFSRLYPLHFATLLLVAAGQYLSWRKDGSFIVYPFNDLRHFLLHLFFASDWGLQKGFSFNSPVWSISVEILIYAIFFSFARHLVPRAVRPAKAIVVAIVVAAIAQKTLPVMELRTVASATVCFFFGGLVYEVWKAMRFHPHRQRAGMTLAAATVCLVSLVVYSTILPNEVIVRLVTFPTTILGLALAQSLWPEAGRSTRLIGDITYSTYLIHFPIQLAILLALKWTGLRIDFYNPEALAGFVSAVILLSIPVYYGFELPMQRWLRAQLLPR